jgi:hypothetical protein
MVLRAVATDESARKSARGDSETIPIPVPTSFLASGDDAKDKSAQQPAMGTSISALAEYEADIAEFQRTVPENRLRVADENSWLLQLKSILATVLSVNFVVIVSFFLW